jgi:hypothetical protein
MVLAVVKRSGVSQVLGHELGLAILRLLREPDEVARLHFASVYQEGTVTTTEAKEMYMDNVRIAGFGSHPGMPPSGWQRVAGLVVVGTVTTVTAVLTGSAETAVAVDAPLPPLLPR